MDLHDMLISGQITGNDSGGGGGGSGQWTTEGIGNRTQPSGVIDITGMSSLKDNGFSYRDGITRVIGVNVAKGYMFENCTGLDSVNVEFTTTATAPFNKCINMTIMVVRGGKEFVSMCNGCSKLQIADVDLSRIRNTNFSSCGVLNTLILRKSTPTGLEAISAFNNTPFKNGGSGGTIYIPTSLYDHLGDGTSNDYQSLTNWSSVYGYGTITWAKIEGSIYENAYADGTPIS